MSSMLILTTFRLALEFSEVMSSKIGAIILQGRTMVPREVQNGTSDFKTVLFEAGIAGMDNQFAAHVISFQLS